MIILIIMRYRHTAAYKSLLQLSCREGKLVQCKFDFGMFDRNIFLYQNIFYSFLGLRSIANFITVNYNYKARETRGDKMPIG